jgi:D-alanyl-D-alanine carboxypeptidase (penicillin-binding protein 5/6)
LISVILGEKAKAEVNEDTVALLEYGFGRYKQLTLTEKDQLVAELAVPYSIDRKLRLVTKTPLSCTVHVDDQVERSVTLSGALALPVRKGDVLGKVTYTVSGRSAGSVDLVATEDIGAPTLGIKVRYYWARFMAWVGKIV